MWIWDYDVIFCSAGGSVVMTEGGKKMEIFGKLHL